MEKRSFAAAAARKLKLSKAFHIGLNFWYLAPVGRATDVLKVRAGELQEVGLAEKRLTKGRKHKPDS